MEVLLFIRSLMVPLVVLLLINFSTGEYLSKREERTPSQEQLINWATNNSYYNHGIPRSATNLHGSPLPSLTASETIGNRGEMLMQDHFFMEKMASFTRERVPERVVHAKGTGAHGYFEVTHDISHFTKAKFLNGIGKKTPVFTRLSTAVGGRDSADTLVDQLGFATKFYTEEGIHDLLCLTIEPFSLFDPMLFIDLNHSRKKNPVTGQTDFDSWWDYVSRRPESTHHLLHLFSDRGRPDGYRVTDAFAVNVFRLVNATDGVVYGKFHWRSNTPWKYLTFQESEQLAGSDPEYRTKDLYNAIGRGEFPSWTLYIQVMTEAQIKNSKSNPFDVTRVWRREEFPLIPVGDMILNRNPVNQFAEVEQIAFAPSNMAPGIAASGDRIQAGRIFAYPDAHRYRFGGPNFAHLPINRPISEVNSYQRDGPACHGNNGNGAPNYYPNSFGGPEPNPDNVRIPPFGVNGIVARYDFQEDDPFEQPRIFLERDVSPEERVRLVNAMADYMKGARKEIRERVLKNNFYKVDKRFGDELRAAIEYALKNDWRDQCRWGGPKSNRKGGEDRGGWGREERGQRVRTEQKVQGKEEVSSGWGSEQRLDNLLESLYGIGLEKDHKK